MGANCNPSELRTFSLLPPNVVRAANSMLPGLYRNLKSYRRVENISYGSTLPH